MKFLGQIINERGICPDPAKIAALHNVSEPKCVADVRRFLGMMSKFLPTLADTIQPLRKLLKASVTGPEKTTQNTHIHIMVHISCSV